MSEMNGLKKRFFEQIDSIGQLDCEAMAAAWEHWDQIGKPLRSLGLLEKAVVKMAGIQKSADVRMDKKALVVMCGDHGVVEEGVTQTGSEVTRIVAENMTTDKSTVKIMARRAGVDVFIIDVGMKGDYYPDGPLVPDVIQNRKQGEGTGNIAVEPAMTYEACLRTLMMSMDLVGELKAQGYQILATGEMGIGNTTPSSALASVLLDMPAMEVTGRGAGLSDMGLLIKQLVVERAVERYEYEAKHEKMTMGVHYEAEKILRLMRHLGGYEIVGLTGLMLGAAVHGVPIVLDGFISASAALCATHICKKCTDWMLASHVSAEPAGRRLLKWMQLEPVIDAGMCLGEGTGAVAGIGLYETGLTIYQEMGTFSDIQVKPYAHYRMGEEDI